MQNAEELLAHRNVRQLLDGIAKEDLLHGVTFTEAPNDRETVANSLKDLNRAKGDRIPVFAVEYLSDPTKVAVARERLVGFGFVPLFAPRLLDRLLPQPGDEPNVPAPAPATTKVPGQQARGGAPGWAEGGPTCLRD